MSPPNARKPAPALAGGELPKIDWGGHQINSQNNPPALQIQVGSLFTSIPVSKIWRVKVIAPDSAVTDLENFPRHAEAMLAARQLASTLDGRAVV